jgi:murein DD-endopeptidase MepM/ murein hydrolase activator NlpD
MTWIEPFPKSKRGDGFGNLAPYRNGRPHRGLDWSVKEGSVIKAITTGRVIENAWSDVLGWYLIHSAEKGKSFVIYAHLKEKSKLEIDQVIRGGEDIIGQVGNTGSATTGAHLHLSIAKTRKVHLCSYDELIDPAPLFENK